MAQFCSICGKSARDTAKFCQGCGTPFMQILQAGSTLDRGRYQVLKPLKSGGMGAVYLLHDSRLERKCVLKEMVPPSHGYLTEFVESREKDYLSGRKVPRCNSLKRFFEPEKRRPCNHSLLLKVKSSAGAARDKIRKGQGMQIENQAGPYLFTPTL